MNTNKLLALIDEKKITKAKVVRETGISRPALDSILCGNDFKVSNLEKLAKCLSVSVGYFFDEDVKIETREAGRDYFEKSKLVHKGPEYNCGSNEADLREQIAQLKSQLEDKERIIKLLEKK